MTERFSKESAANELAAHPAAELFPLLDEEGIQPLVSDIGQNGLQNPIVLHEGKILDGRNRYRACLRAGVEPQFVEWEDPGCGPNHWVISQNLIRRHLTVSQRAVIALDVLPMFEKEARERQGARIDITAQMPEGSGEARKHAAKALIVSPRYVSEAKKIAAEAPDLIVAIRSGKKTIKDAKRELIRRERDVHKTMLLTGLPPLSERYQLYNRDIADIPGVHRCEFG